VCVFSPQALERLLHDVVGAPVLRMPDERVLPRRVIHTAEEFLQSDGIHLRHV
jgi:hypothetical protein